MLISVGGPKYRIEEARNISFIKDLRSATKVAVIDDERFRMADSLKAHGFLVDELGGNIRSWDQLSSYPVVVCDIRGVGSAFQSEYEGAHVISELKKIYPDKYVIAYTGMTHSIKYNQLLAAADTSMSKDARTEEWVEALDTALKEVGTPYKRWLRLRSYLAREGIDAYDIFTLEQAFVASCVKKSPQLMELRSKRVSGEVQELVGRFVKTALAGMGSGGDG